MTRWINLTSITCLFLALLCLNAPADEPPAAADHVLWYRSPAENWEKEALPIGNGRLGGMVFGGVDREHLQFNEDSLWIGDEQDTGAYRLRRLCFSITPHDAIC